MVRLILLYGQIELFRYVVHCCERQVEKKSPEIPSHWRLYPKEDVLCHRSCLGAAEDQVRDLVLLCSGHSRASCLPPSLDDNV